MPAVSCWVLSAAVGVAVQPGGKTERDSIPGPYTVYADDTDRAMVETYERTACTRLAADLVECHGSADGVTVATSWIIQGDAYTMAQSRVGLLIDASRVYSGAARTCTEAELAASSRAAKMGWEFGEWRKQQPQ